MGFQPDQAAVVRVVDTLLDPVLEPIVDMVLTADGDGYEARAIDGRVRFRRHADGDGWHFDEIEVEGRNPLADTATDRFSPLADERAHPWPTRAEQSYPHAHEHIAQVFDHPSAPGRDLPAHRRPQLGGPRGTPRRAWLARGRPGARPVHPVRRRSQATGPGAPLVPPGGCRSDRACPSRRSTRGPAPSHLATQDGKALTELFDEQAQPAAHVVGFLWDGCNPNVLYDLVRAVRRPTWLGSSTRGRRWVTVRWPRCHRSRWRTTRPSSPAPTRAITAFSTTPGTTGPPASRSSPTHPRPGLGRCRPFRRTSRPSTRRSIATGRMPAPCRSTSPVMRVPTTRPSRSCAKAAIWLDHPAPTSCRSRPSASCGPRRATSGRRGSTTAA